MPRRRGPRSRRRKKSATRQVLPERATLRREEISFSTICRRDGCRQEEGKLKARESPVNDISGLARERRNFRPVRYWTFDLVPVVLRLERTVDRDTEIFRLIVGQLGELD